jgi:hypothetical protein
VQWFEEGSRYSLSIEHYIMKDTVTWTSGCQLGAIDFLCLRRGRLLSDTVMDAALATLCMEHPDSTTISALLWGTTSSLKDTKDTREIVLSACFDGNRIGIFMDQPTSVTETMGIYNSFGSSDVTSATATKHVSDALVVLG